MSTIDLVNRLVGPLRTRVANMVARAVVQLVADGGKLQTVQLGVLDGETRDGCERFQEYGFTSVPLPGAEAVVVFVGGRRDHGLVTAVDDRRYRPNGLGPGDVCLYHKDGSRILMKEGGEIEVTAAEGANIVLNGGGASVARVGDATVGHTHSFSATVAGGGGGTVTGTTGSAIDTIKEGDQLPDGATDRRGWWGDEFSTPDTDRIGSRLWLIERAKDTEEVRARAEEYAAEALAWMVEDKLAARVEVSAEVPRSGWLVLNVSIHRPSRSDPIRFRFNAFWASKG